MAENEPPSPAPSSPVLPPPFGQGESSAWHSPYNRLEEILGTDNSDTLMTSLPPQPGAELAAKADLSAVRDDFRSLRVDFDRLEAKLDSHMRTFYVASLGAMTGLIAIFGVIVTVSA